MSHLQTCYFWTRCLHDLKSKVIDHQNLSSLSKTEHENGNSQLKYFNRQLVFSKHQTLVSSLLGQTFWTKWTIPPPKWPSEQSLPLPRRYYLSVADQYWNRWLKHNYIGRIHAIGTLGENYLASITTSDTLSWMPLIWIFVSLASIA